MAESLRLVITAEDQASPAIQRVASQTASTLERTQEQIVRGNNRVIESQQRAQQAQLNTARAAEQLTQAQNRTVQSTIRVAQTNTAAAREQERLRQATLNTEQAAVQLQKQQLRLEQQHQHLSQSTTSLIGIYRQLQTVLVALGFSRVIQQSIETATRFRTVEISFRSVLGTAQSAKEELAFFRQESERLGLVFLDTAESARGLLAATQGTILQGEGTRDIFLAIAESGRVLGASQDQLNRSFLATQQIIARGRVDLENLNQLAEASLPQALQVFSRALGITTAEVLKMSTAGTLGLREVLLFAQQLRREAAPGIDEASHTFQAGVARFRNATNELLAALGRLVTESPQAVAAITGISERFQALAQTIERNQSLFQALGLLVGTIIDKLLKYLDTWISVLGFFVNATKNAFNAVAASPEGKAAIALFQTLKAAIDGVLASAQKIPGVHSTLQAITALGAATPRPAQRIAPEEAETAGAQGFIATRFISAEEQAVARLAELHKQLSDKVVGTATDRANAILQQLSRETQARQEAIRKAEEAFRKDEAFAQQTIRLMEGRVEAQARVTQAVIDERERERFEAIKSAADIATAQIEADDAYRAAVVAGVDARLQEREREAQATQQAFARIQQRTNQEIERETERTLQAQEQDYQRFRDRLEDDFADTFRRLPELAKDPLGTLLNLFEDFAAQTLATLVGDLIDPLLRQLHGLSPAVQQATQQTRQLTTGGLEDTSFLFQQPGTPRQGQAPAAQAGATIATTAGAPLTPTAPAGGPTQTPFQVGTQTAGAGLAGGITGNQLAGVAGLTQSTEGQIGAIVGAAVFAAIGTYFLPGIGTYLGAVAGSLLGGFVGNLFAGNGPTTRTTPLTRPQGSPSAFTEGVFLESPFGAVGLSRDASRRTSPELSRAYATFLQRIDQQIASVLTDRQEEIARTFLQARPGATQTFRGRGEGELQEVLVDRLQTIARGLIANIQGPGGAGGIARNVFAEFQGGLEGDVDIQAIVSRFGELLEVVNAIEAFANPQDLTQSEQAIKAVNDEFDRLVYQAQRFGLATGVLEQGRAQRLQELTSGFNESIQDQILGITDPQALALAQLDRQQEERRREATALGADLVAIERLYGLEREQIFRDSVDRQTEFAQSIQDQILGITDPQALALVQLDRQQEERVRNATELGQSLVDVERLYALERQQILEEAGRAGVQSLEGIRNFLQQMTAGPQSPLPTQERLGLAQQEFATQRSAAFDAIAAGTAVNEQALTQAANNLIEASRTAFASGPQFFEQFAFIRRTLETILTSQANSETATLSLIEESSSNTASNTFQATIELRAMREEIAALRAELTRLRAGQIAGAA